MSELLVDTPDGRALDVTVAGREDGPLVLVQHGTPGGGTLPGSYVSAAGALGVRLAAWARPGYARSTRRPGRTVADVAADAVAVADALGAQRFAVTGGSGGGPHALAVGALVPERCVAVATVASVAPWDAEGLDPLEGMGEGNVEEFGAVLQGEQALAPLLEQWRAELLDGGVDGMLAVLRTVLSPPDLAVLTGEVAAEAYGDMRRGLAPSADGWVDDDLAFVRPWGFTPQDVRVPVDLWQGGEDLMVPPAHGRWLADRLPDVRPHLLPGDGHLTLHVTRAREVLAPLASALSGAPA